MSTQLSICCSQSTPAEGTLVRGADEKLTANNTASQDLNRARSQDGAEMAR
jgi:hypothetical protein